MASDDEAVAAEIVRTSLCSALWGMDDSWCAPSESSFREYLVKSQAVEEILKLCVGLGEAQVQPEDGAGYLREHFGSQDCPVLVAGRANEDVRALLAEKEALVARLNSLADATAETALKLAPALGLAPFDGPLPSGLETWLPEYVVRKATVATSTLTLTSGRTLAYSVDGPDDGTVVLCIPGLGCGKEVFLLPEQVAGARQISIDRLGHGSSDEEPDVYGAGELTADLMELLDSLGATDCCVLGHGLGGAYALDLAVALGARAKGLGLLAGWIDTTHASLTDEDREAIGVPTGWQAAELMNGLATDAAAAVAARVKAGAGVRGEYEQHTAAPMAGTSEASPFLLCALVDGGCKASAAAASHDVARSFSAHAHDMGELRCPVRLSYPGHGPIGPKVAALAARLLPEAACTHEVFEELGLVTILRELPPMIAALVHDAAPVVTQEV